MALSLQEQMAAVNEAFSRQAPVFDQLDTQNPILLWMRQRVYHHLLALLPANSRLLEINAGTGIDAVFWASQGHRVLATDWSEGMVKAMEQKVSSLSLEKQLRVQRCSYTELHRLQEGDFDCIFSNFGGLNCVPDLQPVLGQFASLLKPGGLVSLVIMPPVCPWELLYLLRGEAAMALRRLRPTGSPAHLEGISFQSWYFSPGQVMAALGPAFEKLRLEGLGSLVPPPYMENFPRRFPRLFKWLCRQEEKIARYYPCSIWADHFVLTARRREQAVRIQTAE